jgi:hypothetical protein
MRDAFYKKIAFVKTNAVLNNFDAPFWMDKN